MFVGDVPAPPCFNPLAPSAPPLLLVLGERPGSQPVVALMLGCTFFLLWVAFGNVTRAFRSPSSSSQRIIAVHVARYHQTTSTSSLKTNNVRGDKLRLSISQTDDDAELTKDIETMDNELVREIDAALALALDAMAAPDLDDDDDVDSSLDEDDIDAIANMLLETPRIKTSMSSFPSVKPQPIPLISIGLDMAAEAAVEIERVRNAIFGVEGELAVVKANTAREEEITMKMKNEIEASIKDREEMVQRINFEFATEAAMLVDVMESASLELSAVLDECAQNITEANAKVTDSEKGLISRVDSFKASIDKVRSEIMEINMDKEQIERSKQTILEKIALEGKNKMSQMKRSFNVDNNFARTVNAERSTKADEAEQKVRDVLDQMILIRSERVSLQQQLVDVENKALEEISFLQREIEQDEKRYANALQKEQERLDNAIDVAYQAYAAQIVTKISKRKAVEADLKERLRPISMKLTAAKAKQEARVKEYLDKLEEKHKRERIEIYKEKFKAVSAIREKMTAELTVEYAKIDEMKTMMQAKIDAVDKQTAKVKADFEMEMTKRRQLSKDNESVILNELEDIKSDMMDKIKTQRRIFEEKKAAYSDDMNIKISDSDNKLRSAWKELASIKSSYSDLNAKRDSVQTDVAKSQALIDAYENDRDSFRKSFRLTVKVAKDKVKRKLLRRSNHEDSPW